jgi:outer membrane immunogenic protein
MEANMKKILLGGFALLALGAAGPATATDLLGRPAGMGAPVYDWTGFYAGGHAGYGWGSSLWEFPDDSFWNLAPGDRISIDPSGWLAGGQVGFNYQTGSWLFGVEGTFSGAHISRSVTSPFFPDEDIVRTRINSLYTVAARLGAVWNDLLFYGKAGWAGGEVQLSAVSIFGGGTVWNPAAERRSGWVAGAGLEYMLMPNVIVGVEYNYIDLGGQT